MYKKIEKAKKGGSKLPVVGYQLWAISGVEETSNN